MATSATTIARLAGVETGLVWILAAYFIPASVSTIVFGRLGDAFGPMRMLVFSLLVFAAGSLFAAQSQGFAVLILARVVQGIGGGGLVALPQAFLAQRIPPRDRAAYQGYLVAVAFMANTFGPAVGSILIGRLGWQSIFYTFIPMALLAALLLWRARSQVPVSRPAVDLKFDWPGTLMLIVTVSCLILASQALSEPGQAAKASLWIAGFFLSLLAMIIRMCSAQDPLVPVSLIRIPVVWKCGLVVFLYGALFTGVISLFPILFRDHYGLRLDRIGVFMMPFLGAVGIGSILTGLVVRKTGRLMILTAGGLAVFAILIVGIALSLHRMDAGQMAFALGIAGVGMGTTLNVVNISVQTRAPAEMLGRVTAFVQLSRTVGASLGVGIGTLIYFRSLNGLSGGCAAPCPGAVGDAFTVLLYYFAALSMAAALIAHANRRVRLT